MGKSALILALGLCPAPLFAHTQCETAVAIIGLRGLPHHVQTVSAKVSTPPAATSSSPFAATPQGPVGKNYERFLKDTYRGLQEMRGENHLVMDTVIVAQDGKGGFKIVPYKAVAAPTDIGLDLLAQTGMARNRSRAESLEALETLDKVLSTLETLPFDKDSGLFHRLYDTKKNSKTPVIHTDISSVDNLHLALGLWTVAQTFPDLPVGKKAKKLFERMDFSCFYDRASGLLGGNISGGKLENYRYRFGSEARSIYTVGHALGLFRKLKGKEIEDAMTHIPIEISRKKDGDIVHVWNGGTFQALLPRLLINEELYSGLMSESAKNTSAWMAERGPELTTAAGKAFRMPAGHSAAVVKMVKGASGKVDVIYSGEVGDPQLTETDNPNVMDNSVVTMHAVLLGATTDPLLYAERLAAAEGLKNSGENLYLKGFGFVDSARMEKKGNTTVVIPNSAGVGVDKTIEVLALLQILSSDGLSESGRAMVQDREVATRLNSVYAIVDRRWRDQRELAGEGLSVR